MFLIAINFCFILLREKKEGVLGGLEYWQAQFPAYVNAFRDYPYHKRFLK
jgi:hypothetical protein